MSNFAHDNVDSQIDELMSELADHSTSGGWFTAAQVGHAANQIARDMNISPTDHPADAAEKMERGKAEFGISSIEVHPDVIAAQQKMQDSYRELSTSVRRGEISNFQAALEWEQRHGSPEHAQQIIAREADRINHLPLGGGHTDAEIARERQFLTEQARIRRISDPVQSTLAGIEWMLKEIKEGR